MSSTQAEASGGYQGWRNYETWTVAIWIDNDLGTFRYWREMASHCQREAPNKEQVTKGIWTPIEAARFNLADKLKEEATEGHPLNWSSMYADLLSAALSEVDWHEIAESILVELE